MISRGFGALFIILAVACGSDDASSGGGEKDAGAGGGAGTAGAGGTSGDAAGGGAGEGAGGSAAGGAGGSGGQSGAGAASGSSGASGSAGGGATAGSSGSGATGGTPPCVDPDGVDPDVQGTATGTNGPETDECDVAGNLTEYFCEKDQSGCGANPPPDCGVITGSVFQRTWDCGGQCASGTCPGRCPAKDDAVSYISVNAATGDAVLEIATREYDCTLVTDAPGGFDCMTGPSASSSGTVRTVAITVAFCTASAVGSIGVQPAGALGLECTYSCSLAP